MGNGESRVNFCSKLMDLKTRPVDSQPAEYWSSIFKGAIPVEEIFSHITLSDVRVMKESQKLNLAMLILKCIEQLSIFAYGPPQPHGPVRIALALLTRALPAAFEADQAPHSAESAHAAAATAASQGETLINSNILPPLTHEFSQNLFMNNQVVIRDTVHKFDSMNEAPLTRPLIHELADALSKLCFVDGFTLAPTRKIDEPEDSARAADAIFHHIDRTQIWYSGIGVPRLVETGTFKVAEIESNRCLVLRCILSAMSEKMFYRDAMYKGPFTTLFLGGPNKRNAFTLFYCLMNAILGYDPTGFLPYSSYVGAEPYENMASIAVQVLIVGLDYAALGYKKEQNTSESSSSSQTVPEPIHLIYNATRASGFWSGLMNMRTETEFKYISAALFTLLSVNLKSLNTYLPSSQRPIRFHAELIVLLWKLVENNKEYRTFLGKSKGDFLSLLTPVLYYMYECRHNEADLGLLQVCLFTLLSLTCERDICIGLNRPFSDSSILGVAFDGSFADVIVYIVHELCFHERQSLRNMCDNFLALFGNIAPYYKKMNMASAQKIIHFIEVFGKPKLIQKHNLKPIHTLRLVFSVINNILQFQYDGCVTLVYQFLVKENRDMFMALYEYVQSVKPEVTGESERDPLSPAYPITAAPSQYLQYLKQIPLETVKTMIQYLVPAVAKYCKTNRTEKEILDFLSEISLVGVIPVKEVLEHRQFDMQYHHHHWMNMWTWGLVFMKCTQPKVFDQNTVQLFRLLPAKEAQRNARNIQGKMQSQQQQAPQQQSQSA